MVGKGYWQGLPKGRGRPYAKMAAEPSSDLKEGRELAMQTFTGRVFLAQGTASAKALWPGRPGGIDLRAQLLSQYCFVNSRERQACTLAPQNL